MIKKNVKEYYKEILEMYMTIFDHSKQEAEYDLTHVINLEKSYGLIENNELVSFVGIVEKTVLDESNEYKIALLLGVMTKPSYRGSKRAINLIKEIENELVNSYDSVCLQTKDWEIYKDLDLVNSTIKTEARFIKGEYPTPMIMTWSEPNANMIQDIESQVENNKIGVLRDVAVIEQNVKVNQALGLSFKANPFAYVWYNKQTNKLVEFVYTNAAQLCWVLNTIQPDGVFLLFKDQDLKEIPCLELLNKDVILTKTFAKSKKIFNNIKLIDYVG